MDESIILISLGISALVTLASVALRWVIHTNSQSAPAPSPAIQRIWFHGDHVLPSRIDVAYINDAPRDWASNTPTPKRCTYCESRNNPQSFNCHSCGAAI